MVNNRLCKLRIALLGSFYLEVDGLEIEAKTWKSKKALTLLKYLAAQRGQKVPSDVLIELLWPENELVPSTSNLHTAVWSVRRVLAGREDTETESRLRYSNGSYWLDMNGDGCVDTDKFELHVKTSKQLEEEDPTSALGHCESALLLYRGDFLHEDIYEEWTSRDREYYRELYFEVTLRMTDLLREHSGDYTEAVKVCKEGLRKDPYREELYQSCLKALIKGERYVEAINLYKHCSQILMEEFQLEPSPTTQKIIANMRRFLAKEEDLPVLSVEVAETEGAYSCGRAVFQSILDIEQRRFKRKNDHFSIIVIYAKDNANWMLREYQEAFLILQNSLRGSDVICRWSSSVVTLFLPETIALATKVICRRLEQALQSQLRDSIVFDCDILSSEYLGDMNKKWHSILVNQ